MREETARELPEPFVGYNRHPWCSAEDPCESTGVGGEDNARVLMEKVEFSV